MGRKKTVTFFQYLFKFGCKITNYLLIDKGFLKNTTIFATEKIHNIIIKIMR